ncbi:tetratricopeptide repeat protein [Glycomyces tarimensis]
MKATEARAREHIEAGRFTEATTVLEGAALRYGHEAVHRLLLAWCLYKTERPEGARERAVEAAPEDPDAHWVPATMPGSTSTAKAALPRLCGRPSGSRRTAAPIACGSPGSGSRNGTPPGPVDWSRRRSTRRPTIRGCDTRPAASSTTIRVIVLGPIRDRPASRSQRPATLDRPRPRRPPGEPHHRLTRAASRTAR